MKVRRMVSLLVSVVLLLACMTAQAGSAKFEAVIDGICERGVLIEGILPGMSKEEVEEEGIVFSGEVRGAYTGDNGMVSEIYAVDSEKAPVFLSGVQMDEVSFQFVDGRLINICLDTDNMEVLASAYNSLFGQMGMSEDKSMGDEKNMTLLQQWTASLDGMTLRAGMTVAMRNGEPAFGSVQFSWLDDETFGESLGVKTAKIEGLKERNFILIDGILPGMSKEEVEAAGIVFDDKPMGIRTSEGRSFETVDWPAHGKLMRFKVLGKEIKGAMFQFDDDRLSCIQLVVRDGALMLEIEEALIQELGEADGSVIRENKLRQTGWDFKLNGMTARVTVISHYDAEGHPYSGSMQVSYFMEDLYPDMQMDK